MCAGRRAAAVFEAALEQSEQQGGEVSSGTRRDSGGSSTRVNSGSSTRRGSGGGLNGRMSSLAASSGGRDDFGDEQPLAALFCVFDGHCGRLAAEQAAQLLPRELADRIDPRQLLQVRVPPLGGVQPAEAPLRPSCPTLPSARTCLHLWSLSIGMVIPARLSAPPSRHLQCRDLSWDNTNRHPCRETCPSQASRLDAGRSTAANMLYSIT